MPASRFPLLAPLIVLLFLLLPKLHSQSAFHQAHQSDTVAWRSWSPELIETAKAEDKPLFFFVGHYGNSLARAMLHETFRNETIADTLNETSVPVLVDVNEDAELATFLRRLAFQHFDASELPTCLWTDSDLAPLNGGGYFPPTDDWGGQGFLSLARNVDEQWKNSREDFRSIAKDRLKQSSLRQKFGLPQLAPNPTRFPETPFLGAEAPTLPALALYNYAHALPTLPAEHATSLQAALASAIERITSGAGFDSVSGGFFSGSNDAAWRLPLFQKSTSDQALMVLGLSQLNKIDPKPEYAFLIEATIRFIDESLENPSGNSLQYLDSFAPGETPESTEGSYYLISAEEAKGLSPEAAELWGLTEQGNLDQDTDILGLYSGQNVPYAKSKEVLSDKSSELRNELLAIRASKPKPLSDNSGYTATNALIVKALAAAASSVGVNDYTEAAITRFNRIIETAYDSDSNRLYNSDQRSKPANSLDYTYLISAALDLHDATGNAGFLATAKTITQSWESDERFSKAHPIAHPSGIEGLHFASYEDSAIPSAAAMQLSNLLRLEGPKSKAIESILSNVPSLIERHPERFRSLFTARLSSTRAR